MTQAEILQKFIKHCQRTAKIYLQAKQNFQYCYYMYKPETLAERQYTQKDSHLQIIRHSLWQITIIEIVKLFVNNKETQKYNLHKLLNGLKCSGEFKKMNIDETTIQGWETYLRNKEQLIETIETLRNKLYAHTDSNIKTDSGFVIPLLMLKNYLLLLNHF